MRHPVICSSVFRLFVCVFFYKYISNQVHFEPLLTALLWASPRFSCVEEKEPKRLGFLVAEFLGLGLFWFSLWYPWHTYLGDVDLGWPTARLASTGQPQVLEPLPETVSSAFRVSGTSPWSALLWSIPLPFPYKGVPLGLLGIGQAALCLRYLLISSDHLWYVVVSSLWL